ncbi:MAG: methyltransferase domain-containing protein [Bacteroidetes bacterium]|nr:methyltransferase domain-containing protein [Bacteroidota bacterium]
MPDLKIRSYQKELLDRIDIPFADIQQNMKELNTVNTLLGGHAITIKGVKSLLQHNQQDEISICETGCGGGDNLQAIAKWSRTVKKSFSFIGIDIKASCIEYAALQYPSLKAQWICSDYADVQFGNNKPTLLFSSLFCHHFTEEELINMMKWMKQNSKTGFFINDLQRHPLAYHLIKWLTRIFSSSYLVKNDAPLSVARGFTKKEWKNILQAAGITNYTIQWKWAFRYLIICRNEQ